MTLLKAIGRLDHMFIVGYLKRLKYLNFKGLKWNTKPYSIILSVTKPNQTKKNTKK